MECPYKVLAVNKTANLQDIKHAFRKLARVYHPDKTSNDKTKEEIFKKVRVAYEELSKRVPAPAPEPKEPPKPKIIGVRVRDKKGNYRYQRIRRVYTQNNTGDDVEND